MKNRIFKNTYKSQFDFFTNIVNRNISFLKWQARDLIRLKAMRWLSYARFLGYIFLKLIKKQQNLSYLMDAHRYYSTEYLNNVVYRKKQVLIEKIDFFVESIQQDQFNMVASRSIVLKNPNIQEGQFEKGVLLITFTETFPFFHKYIDCEQLLKYFYVVLEPSWAGYCNPNILFWMKYKSYPIVVQSAEQNDYSFLLLLKSNLIPVDFGASDWVDFRIFRPISGLKKKFDVIYVCTYKPIKRHHVLFKAISNINDPSYKAALVCVRWGGKRLEIDHLIDYYGIKRNITIYEDMSPIQVNELLNMSKVNVLLSLKEGSNRSIFEGFFANIPGIVLKNNIGVNKSYINAMTGRLILENKLMDELLYFRENWARYNARDWAMKNISPLITTKKLSECLKKIAHDNNEPWTQDIVSKVNVPEVKYLFTDDKQKMLDSETIISLFLRTKVKKLKNEQILKNHIMDSIIRTSC